MASQSGTGTGKHPHKDTQEPYPHTRENASQHGGSTQHGGSSSKGQQHAASHSDNRQQSSGTESEKSREYRDEQGNVHHHTKTYMEQHGKK